MTASQSAAKPPSKSACPDACRCCVTLSGDAIASVYRRYAAVGLLPAPKDRKR